MIQAVVFRFAKPLTRGDHFGMTSQPADEHHAPAADIPGASRPNHRYRSREAGGRSVTKATRISGTWIALIVATIVLIFLLVFILQNLGGVTVSFLGFPAISRWAWRCCSPRSSAPCSSS